MVNFGIVIVIGAIVVSMAAGMFMYSQYQTNYITAIAGETVVVGPTQYTISFEGTHDGDKETVPENTFVMIGISAENISEGKTLISGGNFTLLIKKNKNIKQSTGNFHQKTYSLKD